MKKASHGFPGARFYKTDLHIHTPASKCWLDEKTPDSIERIFDQLAAQGIEVVAITDHNSVESIDKAKVSGKRLGIYVFPGVEVSTKEGHILAIFDVAKPTSEIDDWLTRLGFTKSERGTKNALAQDQHGNSLSITAVFDLIEKEGGIAIAPHPNSKGTGFLEVLKQKGTARQQAYCSRSLRGLEVGDDKDKILQFASGNTSGYPKKYGCVANSDAHSIDKIGSAFTYIKLGDIGIGALKQAFYDPAMRIRFAETWPPEKHCWIRTLEVNQGFFAGAAFSFHPEMNSIVGGKATGKSLLIELIRFALGSTSPIHAIAEENFSKINATTCLGPNGTVTLHVVSADGEQYRIQRTVSEFDAGPEIYFGGTQTKAADHVADIVRSTVYSQNEIIELGRSLSALTDWLDSFIDLSKERSQASSMKTDILGLLRELDNVNAIAAGEKELDKRLQELRSREALLSEKNKAPILKEYPLWQKEQRMLKTYANGVGSLRLKVGGFFSDIDWEEYFPQLDAKTPNIGGISAKRKVLLKLRDTFNTTNDALHAELLTKEGELKRFSKAWTDKFDEIQKKHEKLIQEAGVSNISALISELDKAGGQIDEQTRALKKARKAAARKSEIDAKLWYDLIPNYNACFSEIFAKRVKKAEALSNALEQYVRISVRQMSDRTAYAAALTSMAKGSHLRKQDIDAIASTTTPLELTKYLAKRDGDGLAKHAGIQGSTATMLVEHVWEKSADEDDGQLLSQIYKIMFTELQDQVIVELKFADGSYKPMQELSVGSKCTAILSVALVEGSTPLIVDQPEDALDNPFVFEQIVKTVRRNKQNRQFIFATHNSNIAVSSDADLIYCLRATAQHGDVDRHGSIDHMSTRDMAVANLEGGKDAFALRSQKYDFFIDDPHAVILKKE
jgi:hypothetical protein